MLELTYTQAITFIRDMAGIASGLTEETVAKQLYNYYNNRWMTMKELDFTERSYDITTEKDIDSYVFPRYVGRVRDLKFTSGTVLYVVNEVRTVDEWTDLKSGTSTSNIPTHYMLLRDSNNQMRLHIHPTPSVADLTITVYYTLLQSEMTVADYTTGKVDIVTNGNGTVVGSGTTWTAIMVGRWIQLPDNYWYNITARASDTSITVSPVYQGVSQATGANESYVLGEKSLLPPPFSMLPIWATIRDIEAARATPNVALLSQARDEVKDLQTDMFKLHSRRHQSALVDEPRPRFQQDPNDASRATIS